MADRYPSRTSYSDLPSKRKSYSDRWSCVACFLLRSLPSLDFSGASRLTEYLSLEHSSAVWLRQRQIDNLIRRGLSDSNDQEVVNTETSPREIK
jgi:myosin-crossreactive antigen